MAELGEYQHLRFEYSYSIIGTNLSAATTMGTFLLIDSWDRDSDRLPLAKGRLEQDMGIGLLDIAIEELHPVLQRQSKAGGDQGLPRAPLAAGNGNYHLSSHHLRPALGATQIVARNSDLMRGSGPATGANTISSRP